MNTVNIEILDKIISTPLPKPRGNIRRERTVNQSSVIRKLIKDLKLNDISVTSRHFRVRISLPQAVDYNDPEHNATHDQLWREGRHSNDCPLCAKRWQAREAMEKIILAAFPDMDDRSDIQSDYFDFEFMVD